MPRIPLLEDDELGPPELVAATRARRGGGLLDLDRLLLRSPPVAQGWNEMMGRVRRDLALDPMLRELAICAVAVLNGADYELHHHAPVLLASGGTQAQLDALVTVLHDPEQLQRSPLFDARQRAVLELTKASTCRVAVDDATFLAVRDALGDDRLLLELVMTVASYNMVSRVLVAFELAPD